MFGAGTINTGEVVSFHDNRGDNALKSTKLNPNASPFYGSSRHQFLHLVRHRVL